MKCQVLRQANPDSTTISMHLQVHSFSFIERTLGLG